MLLIEMLLTIQEIPLPSWFLPQHTPHQFITTLHQLYPAFLNACRCITGAFYYDRKRHREVLLEAVASLDHDLITKQQNLIRTFEDILYEDVEAKKQKQQQEEEERERQDGNNDEEEDDEDDMEDDEEGEREQSSKQEHNDGNNTIDVATDLSKGKRQYAIQTHKHYSAHTKASLLRDRKKKATEEEATAATLTMQQMMEQGRIRYQYSREYRQKSIDKQMNTTLTKLENVQELAQSVIYPANTPPAWTLLRDLALYWLARWLLVKSSTMKAV